MVNHLLIAVAVIVSLAVVWSVVQALVRRQSPELANDADVLACKSCCHERAQFCSYNPNNPQQAGFIPNPNGGCEYKE